MPTNEKTLKDFADLVPSVELEWVAATYLANLPKGTVIAEIGVGNGELANRLAHQGNVVHGIDISPYCLEKLDAAVTRHEVDVDAQPLPLEAQSVDVMIMFNVLEHLTNPLGFLENAKRVMKPGGLMLAATPNINWLPFRLYFLLGKCPEDFHNTNHVQFWNLKQFKKLFEQTGWQVEKQASSLGLPNPTYPFIKEKTGAGWEIKDRYCFMSSAHAHPLLGYEQVIIARTS